MTVHEERLGQAIEAVAGEIPEGYQVVLSVERFGYSVALKQPNGALVSVDCCSITEEILELLEIAKSQ